MGVSACCWVRILIILCKKNRLYKCNLTSLGFAKAGGGGRRKRRQGRKRLKGGLIGRYRGKSKSFAR